MSERENEVLSFQALSQRREVLVDEIPVSKGSGT